MNSIFRELPVPVVGAIRQSDAVVFEGFDMTGKSYLLDTIKSELGNKVWNYRPDWEGCLSDKVVSRGNRYIPGIALFDVWNNLVSNSGSKLEITLLLDRWLASPYVYGMLYDQETDYETFSDMIIAHEKAVGDLKVVFIYKCHKDIDEAKRFYDMSTKDSAHEDGYDKFESFDDYYYNYCKADTLYHNFFRDMCNFKVYCISSMTNELLEEFN